MQFSNEALLMESIKKCGALYKIAGQGATDWLIAFTTQYGFLP